MRRRRTRSRILKKFPDPPGGNRARKRSCYGRYRHLVRRRSARRTEEQDHPPLGQAGNAALGPERPAHRLDLHLRRNLPERRQGGRPDPAQMQHRGDAAASGRNRKGHRARTSRRPHPRQSRMAYVAKARCARKPHAPAAAGQMSRTQPGRERVGVHARQLALKPRLPQLRRHRRSLLRRLEQAQKSTWARHVHRTARLGARVLINGKWYNLSTPNSVQKLQTALHAKAKAEPGYRFYALYDKIGREDILAHAYAQCRSNKGAPGVDRQDFEAVEAYGVERWLGELALALRQETYRPDPIRRVYIPKANGKLRPLGISTLRDRVCMTAAMLVLEPIFGADLPSELYAYRPGRNAQQAVVEVEELLFRGHPDVVDADLADYFGSIPHAELLKSAAQRGDDADVMHLLKVMLKAGGKQGVPQGGVISPRASRFLQKLVREKMSLFVHWRIGMTGTFA